MKYIALLFLCYIFFCSLFTNAFADSPKDELRRIQKDIRTQKKKLESVKKVESSVLQELTKINAELNKIEKQLTEQKKKIKETQASISALQADIKSNKESLDAHSALLKKRLRVLQRMSTSNDAMLILITKEDTSQIFRTLRYISDISTYDYNLINKYKEAVRVLSEKQNELTRLYQRIKEEEAKLVKLDRSLKEKKKERETLLVNVRKEKSLYEGMIKELQDASRRLSRIIQESEKKETGLKKKKEAPIKEDSIEESDFARLKGKLVWPVNGSIALQYGTQVDPLFNLPVFRSGIHIKTSENSPVHAVYDGKVVFADVFKGYGQLVIISHGSGYHTLYGNLARIFSKNGAIIKKGDSIGIVGESSILGTSALYFEVRYKGKPLDPRQWLK